MNPLSVRRPLLLVCALIGPLVLAATLSVWRDTLNPATSVLLFVVLVVTAATTGDRVAGVLAAISAGAWFDFFLTRPYNTFTIDDPDDIEATVLLVVIGLLVTEVALWGRRAEARASSRAGYLDGVLTTAETVLNSAGSDEHVTHEIADRIADVLEISRCRFVPGIPADPRLALLSHNGVVSISGIPVDVERDGLPTDREIVLRVMPDDEVTGYFLLASAERVARPTLEQRLVAVLLANQTASLLNGTS